MKNTFFFFAGVVLLMFIGAISSVRRSDIANTSSSANSKAWNQLSMQIPGSFHFIPTRLSRFNLWFFTLISSI